MTVYLKASFVESQKVMEKVITGLSTVRKAANSCDWEVSVLGERARLRLTPDRVRETCNLQINHLN